MKHIVSKMKDVIFLIKPFWQEKGFMLASIFIYVFITPLNAVASVLFTQSVIDAVSEGKSFWDVLKIIMVFLLILISTIIIQNTFDNLYSEPKLVKINRNINKNIYNKILRTDYRYFDDPEFYNNFTWAINEYCTKANEALLLFLNICRSVSTIISMITLIATVGPLLILITMIQMALSIYFDMKRNKIILSKQEDVIPIDRKLGYVHRIFYQRQYAEDLRSTNLSEYLFGIFEEENKQKIHTIKKYAKSLLSLLYVQNGIGVFYNTLLLAYISFSFLVSNQIVGIGKFTGLITANSQLVSSLYGFFGFISQANNLSLYAQKIHNFFNIQSSIEDFSGITDEHILPNINGSFDLELKNVCFSYSNSNFSLKNINLTISKGQKIAIVGKNGSGKTTLFKLILRLYDTDCGNIFVNNLPIQKYDIRFLRQKIGMAFQQTNLYAITVKDNVQLYRKFSDEKIMEILAKCKFEGDIHLNGYVTKEFDENGYIFSGGDMQKLGIARIMSDDFGLLLLDEPSSALDPLSEYELVNTLYDRANTTTTIIIAHRLSTIRHADCIYVMDEGQIIESGTHEDLIEQRGVYYDMFTKQAENYK